jgi:hypothetical protein
MAIRRSLLPLYPSTVMYALEDTPSLTISPARRDGQAMARRLPLDSRPGAFFGDA